MVGAALSAAGVLCAGAAFAQPEASDAAPPKTSDGAPAPTDQAQAPKTQPKAGTPSKATESTARESTADTKSKAEAEKTKAKDEATGVDGEQATEAKSENEDATEAEDGAAKAGAVSKAATGESSQAEQNDGPAASTSDAKSRPRTDVQDVATQPSKPIDLSPLDTPLRFEVFGDSVWNTDGGYDLFSDDDVGERFGLLLGLRVATLGSFDLSAQLGYSSEVSQNDDWAEDAFSSTKLIAHHPHLGLMAETKLLPALGLHARVHGGASFVKTRLGRYDQRPSIEDDTIEPFLGGGVGLSLETQPNRLHPTRTSFNAVAFGLRVESGFLWSPALPLAFDDIDADPPDQQQSVRGASLGDLDRSGVYLTLGVFFRL
jgi:hypothetical protein